LQRRAALHRYRSLLPDLTNNFFFAWRGGLWGSLKIYSTSHFVHIPIQTGIMSSNHASLDAASNDRKARLAKLAALKRKQPETDDTLPDADADGDTNIEDSGASEETTKYLSGRNYDAETRGPKLGFEQGPQEGQVTVEKQAAEIAEAVKQQAQKDESADQPIDLFKLQPKKPNWDLRRDLDEKLKILDVRTENAIAKLVRQRIEGAQRAAKERGAGSNGGDQGEEVGIEGEALVEGIHLREQEGNKDEDTI
jgi:coiled-coil domain-containing protein 12